MGYPLGGPPRPAIHPAIRVGQGGHVAPVHISKRRAVGANAEHLERIL